MKRPILKLLAGVAIACTGCGGGGGNGGGGGGSMPTGQNVAPVTYSHTFPSGDATAVAGTAWDIVGVSTTVESQPGVPGPNYNYLVVSITFAQNVQNVLPAPGEMLSNGSQLGVQIQIDGDGNPATGTFAACNYSSSHLDPFNYSTDQGDDPSRLPDGNYTILGPNDSPVYIGTSNPVDEAATSVSGNILTEAFYLPTIGTVVDPAVPKIGIGVVAFNGNLGLSHPTDCVPNGSLIEIFTDRAN